MKLPHRTWLLALLLASTSANGEEIERSGAAAVDPAARSAVRSSERLHRQLGRDLPVLRELERNLRSTRLLLASVEREPDGDAVGLVEATAARLVTLLEQARTEASADARLSHALAQVEPRFSDLFARIALVVAEPDPVARASKARSLGADLPGPIPTRGPIHARTVVHGAPLPGDRRSTDRRLIPGQGWVRRGDSGSQQ